MKVSRVYRDIFRVNRVIAFSSSREVRYLNNIDINI